MQLGDIASIKHAIEFDNIRITWVPLERIARAIEAQYQSV